MATPPSAPPGSTSRRIVGSMQPRVPDLVDRSLRRIRREIAFYRDTDVLTDDEVRRSLTANLAYIVGSIVDGADLDLRAPEDTGRARAAKGVPLADVLAAYRLSFTVLWDEAAAAAQSLPDVSPADLAELAARLFELHERYAGAAVDGYRDEARQMLRTSERERAVLVDVVLAGPAQAGSLWHAARTLGLSLRGSFLVVAAESPRPGHDPLPRVEPALAARDVSSVWRLEASRSLGVLSLGARCRVADAREVLDRHASGRIGVSPAFTELGRAGWARRLAELALETNPRAGVRQYPDSPLDMLVAAAPDTALDVARGVLGDLVDLADDDRDQLLDTFQAWLDTHGSAKDAGAALFCHPNTVRYRLRRIESLTGRDLTDPSSLAEVVIAARAWRQLPHGQPPATSTAE